MGKRDLVKRKQATERTRLSLIYRFKESAQV